MKMMNEADEKRKRTAAKEARIAFLEEQVPAMVAGGAGLDALRKKAADINRRLGDKFEIPDSELQARARGWWRRVWGLEAGAALSLLRFPLLPRAHALFIRPQLLTKPSKTLFARTYPPIPNAQATYDACMALLKAGEDLSSGSAVAADLVVAEAECVARAARRCAAAPLPPAAGCGAHGRVKQRGGALRAATFLPCRRL
jgi:hypothetical protein